MTSYHIQCVRRSCCALTRTSSSCSSVLPRTALLVAQRTSMNRFYPQSDMLEGRPLRRRTAEEVADEEAAAAEEQLETTSNGNGEESIQNKKKKIGGWAASHKETVWAVEQRAINESQERQLDADSLLSPAERKKKFEPEMVPVHLADRPEDAEVEHPGATGTSGTNRVEEEPLASGLRSTIVDDNPYRVSWFYRGHVTPSKRFVYWSYRRLRELPEEWQEYYRRMLRQEVKAARYTVQTWDQFMLVVDGYRKAKWVLTKYGIPIDESIIQKPYNNFWEETTHEERVWAHHRATQMKDLQAMQRDEDSLVFGAMSMDRRDASHQTSIKMSGGMQSGTPVHALDLPAPSEEDIRMSRDDEEMSSALMGSIEDDKLWNPVLKARNYKAQMREDLESFEMEDEEDEAEAVAAAAKRPNVRPGRHG